MKKTTAALGIATTLALLSPLTGSAPSATAAGEETTVKPQRIQRVCDTPSY